MSLDDVFWCAVSGVTATETIPRVYGPHVSLRAPRSNETILGEGDGELRKRRPACFTKGAWTVFVAPEDIFVVEQLFPDREVLKLCCDATNCWSSIEHWSNGTKDWSVYGAMEDDYVRVDGELPEAVRRLVAVTTDCETVPIAVGHAVTGFRHDKSARPRGFQIVDVPPPRELVLSGSPTVLRPTIEQVMTEVDRYLATPLSWLKLTVGEGGGARTLRASHADGNLRVEHRGRTARPTSGQQPIDALDVQRCFRAFFDAGELSTHCRWS